MTKKTKRKNSDVKNPKPTNLFELHINRKKHDVLGMKTKAERGLPGVSRTRSLRKRKVTLLQEFKVKDKRNIFYDRRIGERNSAMTAEDKIIARFTAERMKQHSKKSIYNLGDDEELTHRGQTLTEIEKFDDPKSEDEDDDDDEENGRLNPGFVEDVHFGGGIFKKVEREPKSRKDLIDQLIAESIKRKAEKQKIREHTYNMTEKLDSDWKALHPLVTATKKNKSDPEPETKKDDKFANYDVLSKKLKFEARGKPTDRLKSEEEIAKEEKERLEQLEKERIDRMLGDTLTKTKVLKHRSADDIDDGFDLENNTEPILAYDNGVLNTKAGNGQSSIIYSDANEKDDDSNVEQNENSESDTSDEENSNVTKNGKHGYDDDDDGGDDDDVEEEEDEDNYSDLKESDESDAEGTEKSTLEKLKKMENNKQIKFSPKENTILPTSYLNINEGDEKNAKEKTGEPENDIYTKRVEMEMEAARKELPFTFEIPKEYEDFEALINKYSSDYQSVIVERMIKCHHPSLKEAHKDDLDILFTFLLQHIQDSASDEQKKKNCFKTLEVLSSWMFDLTQWNPINCSSNVMEVIREKFQDFCKNSTAYPAMDTLIFLKLVSLLFPTSDYRHPVVTPTLIFMNEIIFRSKIESSVDVSCGLFITTLILEYCSFSKRFSPEAINFLHCVLRLAYMKDSDMMIPSPLQSKSFDSFNLIVTDRSREGKCVRLSAEDLIRPRSDDDFKINALSLALNLLSAFCDFWTEGQFAIFAFERFIPLLNYECLPVSLKGQVDAVYEKIMKFKSEILKMLVLQKKKPKALRLYEPNIEEVHSFKKHKPMGKKKAERAKLLHKYKREMKGALREIRRDRSFLSKLKYRETVKSDMERKAKVQEILSSAAEQQGELRKIQRKKK